MAVVPHPLRAPLQLLQTNPQLSLLPAQAALQLLGALVLLLQLLRRETRGETRRVSGGAQRDGKETTESKSADLDVELGSPQQVERGVPHGVRRQRHLLLELLQALPQLSTSAEGHRQQQSRFIHASENRGVCVL